MQSFIIVADFVLNTYMWLVIIWVVMTWLVSFEVINTHNRLVYVVTDFLYRITEPALRPIRRVVPYLGGIDISPFILILGIWLVRDLMWRYLWI